MLAAIHGTNLGFDQEARVNVGNRALTFLRVRTKDKSSAKSAIVRQERVAATVATAATVADAIEDR